ncbi:unnamed protein product, partial [Auanema sp. JU1783]
MDSDLQPSNTPKIYPSMLTTTTTTTTKRIDSTTITSPALPKTLEQTIPTTSKPISTTSKPIPTTSKTTTTTICTTLLTSPKTTTTTILTTPIRTTIPSTTPTTELPIRITPSSQIMEVTVERRSITKEDLEQQQLLAKAKYAATKFDAEQKFNENITRRI